MSASNGTDNGPSRRSPLGRGLAALIPEDVLEGSAVHRRAGAGVRTVPLDLIQPNPEQPRRRFAEEPLEELTSSVREHGILSPLVVRSVAGGRYVLIAGERRFRAAGMAGLREVPVVVRAGAEGAAEQLELALVENLQRQDLSPIESARGYRRLSDEYGYTQDQIARKVGKNRATIANGMRLLKLPRRVLDLVDECRLSAGHAKALLPIAHDGEILNQIVTDILVKELSVRATENLVRSQARKKRVGSKSKREDSGVHYANDLLTRALQTPVSIKNRNKGGGRIVIDYYSDEELERLITQLRGAN